MPAKSAKKSAAKKAVTKKTVTASSLDSKVYAACDIMRRSNCSGAMNYIPELSWILFLRILDELEIQEEKKARIIGVPFTPSLQSPYRWRDWASTPPDEGVAGKGPGWKRRELTEGEPNRFKQWMNDQLIPHIKELKNQPKATARQKVVSEILSGVERVRIDTDRNLQDVLDKIDGIRQDAIDDTHVFALSQVYEGLLADLGEKAGDGGQFFTPREIIRAVVRIIDPKIGEKVYDPSCGTGGFLAQAFEHMRGEDGGKIRFACDLETLRQETFYGREKENLIYPIALSNLVLHGIDLPHLWHGNTLTGDALYAGLWEGAPPQFDVILSNPPFGGKEGKDAQSDFAYQTKATQILFLQHVIDTLADGGRCGIVLDEGVLFRTTEDAFIRTKRKLLEECDLWCIVSLPGGAFSGAGAGVKTNLLFFTKGRPTKKIWYYDLSDLKVGKRTPFTLDRFEDLFKLLPKRGDSERSWTVDFLARRKQAANDAAPFKAEAENHRHRIEELRELRKDEKRAGSKAAKIDKIDEEINEATSAQREALKRAQAIDDTIYDLKAVNPNAVSNADLRTPAQLIEVIEDEGRNVADALARLRGSLG
jgi:type I restriction enzyme M protein